MQIVAAVARERAGSFSIEKLDLADPRPDLIAELIPRAAPKRSGPQRTKGPRIFRRGNTVRVASKPKGTLAKVASGENRRQKFRNLSTHAKGRATRAAA